MSGFYQVAKQEGLWWFIAPDGKPFFSLGVNCVNMGTSREEFCESNPSYAAYRHYPDRESWQRMTLARLRQWNFNTIGGWSDEKGWGKEMPYTVVLHLGSTLGAPWCDLASPHIARQFDELARKKILPYKDDPHLLGYFTDNELGWWDDSFFLHFLKQPASNATRRHLLQLLRTHYRGDFAPLQHDFDPGEARSFEDLNEPVQFTLKPGGQGMTMINKFTFQLARLYYRLVHDCIRRYDKNHLILGDRYQDFYPFAAARAAAPYVDVISTNHSADWLDGENARFFFDTLYHLTKKPILVTEFYFCATENRSGNKNSSAGFPTVQTQRERAEGFRRNLIAYASLPYVVGAHWFQYYDEPTHGREDGEDYNMGLVDIHDQPYEELTAAAASLDIAAIHRRGSGRVGEWESGRQGDCSPIRIPQSAIRNPERGLRDWNKKQTFVPSATALSFADLYACWDADHLYLAIYTTDYADENLYAGGVIPESERMEWVLHRGQGKKPLRIRFGPGGNATVQGADVSCWEWRGWTRFTLLVAIPASQCGKKKFRAGDTVRLHATLSSHSRAEQMKWQKVIRLGEG